MKAAFGLVALLLGVFGLIWLFAPGGATNYTGEVLKGGQVAREEVNRLAGSSGDGNMTFRDSIEIEDQSAGGKTVGLLVRKVEPSGPAAAYFGLQRGDLITEIGPLPVKELGSDAGIDFLTEAYQKKQTITIVRDERTLILPGGAEKAAAGAPPAPAPVAEPRPAPTKDDRGSLQRQLDNITGTGRGPG
ncbi:MAG: hypothetical protein NZ561_13420 [Phycisphaerae bacterium]|nr:hypothetical protein [Phycisphaerae bacterium]MDW8263611.1 hypothetical protein [Phycisphaerales bacterium]